MNTQDKIFIGNGKLKTFANGGKLINAFLNLSELRKHLDAYSFMSNRDEQTIKIKICPVKGKVGDYYIEIDTWKPTEQPTAPVQAPIATPQVTGDAPF